jgi:hypothetical protein
VPSEEEEEEEEEEKGVILFTLLAKKRGMNTGLKAMKRRTRGYERCK